MGKKTGKWINSVLTLWVLHLNSRPLAIPVTHTRSLLIFPRGNLGLIPTREGFSPRLLPGSREPTHTHPLEWELPSLQQGIGGIIQANKLIPIKHLHKTPLSNREHLPAARPGPPRLPRCTQRDGDLSAALWIWVCQTYYQETRTKLAPSRHRYESGTVQKNISSDLFPL